MTTERQRVFALAMMKEAGFADASLAIQALAEAGRKLHPASNAAYLTRAWDAGRRTLDDLTTREASKLISGLRAAMAYDNPPLGVYRRAKRN